MYFPGCRDIDECRDGSHTCTPPNHICSNTEGNCKKEDYYTNSKNLHISTPISLLLSAATLVSSHIWYVVEYIIQYNMNIWLHQMTNPITREFWLQLVPQVRRTSLWNEWNSHKVCIKVTLIEWMPKRKTKNANHGTWFCFNLFVLLRKLFNTLPIWCQKDQQCHSTFIVGAFSTCIRRFEVHKYIIHTLQYNSTPLWNLKVF